MFYILMAVITNASSEMRKCLCVYDCTVNDERWTARGQQEKNVSKRVQSSKIEHSKRKQQEK